MKNAVLKTCSLCDKFGGANSADIYWQYFSNMICQHQYYIS